MLKINLSKKCIGCGIKLTNDASLEGFTTKDLSERVYCQSCFQIIHYQKPSKFAANNKCDYSLPLKIDSNAPEDQLICCFVDILTFINLENLKLNSNQKIFFIINKTDLLLQYQKKIIFNYWNKIAKNPNNIFLISLKYPANLTPVINQFDNYKKVYCIGETGVGKTTFIKFLSHKNNLIYDGVIGPFLNTTKAVLTFKTKLTKIFDFPGFPRIKGFYSFLTSIKIKKLQQSNWKQWIFQVRDDKVININNFCFLTIELQKKVINKTSIIISGPEELLVSSAKKVNNNDEYEIIAKEIIVFKNTYIINDLCWVEFDFNTKTKVVISLPKNAEFIKIK